LRIALIRGGLLRTTPKPQSELTFSFDDYGKKGSITTEITGAAVIDQGLAIILPAHGNLDILKDEE
jgi:hypothetical protein